MATREANAKRPSRRLGSRVMPRLFFCAIGSRKDQSDFLGVGVGTGDGQGRGVQAGGSGTLFVGTVSARRAIGVTMTQSGAMRVEIFPRGNCVLRGFEQGELVDTVGNF